MNYVYNIGKFEVIGDSSFTVQFHAADGQHGIEAVNQRTGGAFVVRGDDLYLAAVELAAAFRLGLGVTYACRVPNDEWAARFVRSVPPQSVRLTG